jgi:deazaflavin-dependent oxidoreductase (nitroreductase family)
MGVYHRTVQRLGHQKWFAAVGRRLVPVDRAVIRATRGKWSAIGRHGLPHCLLTTTGARSGQPRTTPLLFAADGEDFVVAGSNWGQRHHPAWTANLRANPEAVLTLRDERIPVRARLATGAERARLWELLLAAWPAYRTYDERAGREIRVFVLERR